MSNSTAHRQASYNKLINQPTYQASVSQFSQQRKKDENEEKSKNFTERRINGLVHKYSLFTALCALVEKWRPFSSVALKFICFSLYHAFFVKFLFHHFRQYNWLKSLFVVCNTETDLRTTLLEHLVSWVVQGDIIFRCFCYRSPLSIFQYQFLSSVVGWLGWFICIMRWQRILDD